MKEKKPPTNYFLIFLIPFIFWNAIIYSAISFFYLSIDPNNWTKDGRFCFIIFGITLGLLISVAISYTLYESNNDR